MYSSELNVPEEVKTPYGTYEIRRFEDTVVDVQGNLNQTLLDYRQALFWEDGSLLDDIRKFEKFTCFVRFDDYANEASLFAFYTPTFDMDGLKKWLTDVYAPDSVRERKKDIYDSLIEAIQLADKPELIQVTALIERTGDGKYGGIEVKEVPASRKIISMGQMKQHTVVGNFFGDMSSNRKSINIQGAPDTDVIRRPELPVELPKPRIPELIPDTEQEPSSLSLKSTQPQREKRGKKEPVPCKIKLLHEPHDVKMLSGSSDSKVYIKPEPILRKFGIFCNHTEAELAMVESLAPYRLEDKLIAMCEVKDYPALDFMAQASEK